MGFPPVRNNIPSIIPLSQARPKGTYKIKRLLLSCLVLGMKGRNDGREGGGTHINK